MRNFGAEVIKTIMEIMDREFDIIVYGASGFTARYIVKDLMKTNLKIALSGRSEERIKSNLGFSSSSQKPPIIISTLDNLTNLTQRGKVLINCVGPFIYYGEEVVKACISTGTHYVDITGETLFVNDMIEKYHAEALENKVHIIPCCGYDSIPADLGVLFLKQTINHKPVWSCSYMYMKNAYANKTSYETLVHNIGKMKISKEIEDSSIGRNKNIYDKNLTGYVRNQNRKIPFFNSLTNTYCLLFPGPDAHTVRRSQELFVLNGLCDPIRYTAYFSVGNFISLSLFLCWMATLILFCCFDFGRKLLIKYPEIFTFGKVRSSGPTEEMIKKSGFKIFFEGLGVVENKSDGSMKQQKVVISVSGPDPGYITTPYCANVAAELLVDMVNGKWKSSFEGGVLTPASSFYGSDVIQRLQKKGLKFEIIKKSEI